MPNLNEKLQHLKEILSEMGSAIIAYSGGVDSTFLVKVAHEILKDKVIAVTIKSSIHPLSETNEAKKMAKKIGVKHLIIETDELSNPEFAINPPERCYFCKKTLFTKLSVLTKEYNLDYILDGSNYDDIKESRPGTRAARQFGVRSPLKEAGLTKKEIRKLSKKSGLSTWNKPAFSCLATRMPYGTLITKESLSMINKAEEFLRSLGINQVRVRHHNHLARIEILQNDIPKILKKEMRNKIVIKFKELGYHHTSVDLERYRTGSMNSKGAN